jgi:hypothetical protein
MINKFLEGKKKYSTFIITILVAIVNMVVADDATRQELTTYIPTAAIMMSGLAYLLIEGIRDIIKVNSPYETPTTTPTTQYTPQTILDIENKPVTPVLQVPEQSTQFAPPFDPKTLFPVSNDPFSNWEQYEDILSLRQLLDLHDFAPAARIPFAIEVISEGFSRLSKAWKSEIKKAGVVVEYDPPTDSVFDDYDGNENWKLGIMKAIPDCKYFPMTLELITIAYGKMYETKKNATLLLDRPIEWEKIHTIEDIRMQGLKAIAAS